jgi:2-dehydro-3-deoxyphosphogluconate aldolase/(4S)-4-hydroxy-2-oxoglutarate aldolase
MPFLRIVPTNGVDASNVAAWLEAGSFAAGFVSALFDQADLDTGRFERVEERGRAILAAAGAPARRSGPAAVPAR